MPLSLVTVERNLRLLTDIRGKRPWTVTDLSLLQLALRPWNFRSLTATILPSRVSDVKVTLNGTRLATGPSWKRSSRSYRP